MLTERHRIENLKVFWINQLLAPCQRYCFDKLAIFRSKCFLEYNVHVFRKQLAAKSFPGFAKKALPTSLECFNLKIAKICLHPKKRFWNMKLWNMYVADVIFEEKTWIKTTRNSGPFRTIQLCPKRLIQSISTQRFDVHKKLRKKFFKLSCRVKRP